MSCPWEHCLPFLAYNTILLATAPAICLSNIGPVFSFSTTIVVLSFSVEDFGCQATKNFLGWYFVNLTSPRLDSDLHER